MPKSPSSLPPAADADTTPAPSPKKGTVAYGPKRSDGTLPSWYVPPDSKVREQAIKMVAMRQAGMSNEEIGKALGCSPNSVNPYIYRAGKNGWIDPDDPADNLEFKLLHKVVRNLDQALDDDARHMTSGMKVGTTVALEVAKGTLFKKFDQTAGVAQNTTVVAVKIEMPEGPRPQVREGNDVGGLPAHVDAEIVNGL